MDLAELLDSNQGAAILFFAAIMALLLLVVAQAYGFSGAHRKHRAWRPYRGSRPTLAAEPDLADVGQQLNAVMAAPFKKRKVLSRLEYRAFRIVEDNIAKMGGGYRVFAQTSLGQILSSPSKHAFRSINSKRVDILVVDWKGHAVLAVEYNGSGHYLGTAAGRDAVKKEALRKAGVQYVEISEKDSDEQIRSRILESLPASAPAH